METLKKIAASNVTSPNKLQTSLLDNYIVDVQINIARSGLFQRSPKLNSTNFV
jgi:hypothetical protein